MPLVVKSELKRRFPSDVQLFFISAIFVLSVLLLVCFFYNPRWETNDDIAMSMVAHGYGLAAYSSPNIIFSNVLWGHIVKSIPTINGILGYSIATIASLFAAGISIFYFSKKLGVGWACSAVITVLALLKPSIFPQFTLNSGLLTIGAVLGLAYYVKTRELGTLVAVVVLGLCGFLIRSQQFVIIVFASLPFLNLKLLIRDKKFQFFCIALFVLILFAVSIDWLSYTGPEWNRFFEINRARAAYTDFGLTDQLKSHPSIIDAHGYTNNDLDLIRSFFFSDPLITKPEMLNSMSSQLGALPFFTANLPLAFAAIKSISSLNILPITLLACVLFVFRPSVRGATAFFSWFHLRF